MESASTPFGVGEHPNLFQPSNHNLLVVLGILHSFAWNYYESQSYDGLPDEPNDPASAVHPKIMSWNWVLFISDMLSKNGYDWELNNLQLLRP